VPHAAKAKAVADTLACDAPDPFIPASLLKRHAAWTLYLDEQSAAG
jgi:6-phosphogluconolactonase/glucosamine-6-phosphate isomerase/deaminase